MYSVLSGKPKSTQTETQALLKLNDQCDRLMKQVETNIERAETHRAEARQTSYRESESQTSKEDRNAVRASPNSAGGCFSHRNEDGVRGEWERERLGGGGGTGRGGNATGSGSGTNSASESTRQMFGVGQKSTEPTDARRAYPAGAFRDDFGTDFVATRGFGEDGNGNGEDEYDGDDADETDNGDKHGTAEIDDERAADRYYRSGVALLENGDASGALASLKKAQQNCPVSRRAAVAKITKKIDDARDVLWNETQTEAATNVAAADAAYRNGLACLQKTPVDVNGAMTSLRLAEKLCPQGRPAAIAKIKRAMESIR
jgi:hypothetical protein